MQRLFKLQPLAVVLLQLFHLAGQHAAVETADGAVLAIDAVHALAPGGASNSSSGTGTWRSAWLNDSGRLAISRSTGNNSVSRPVCSRN